MTVKSYYNYAKLFSFNATIMGVIGGRGLGKTFGAKDKATRDALKVATFTEKYVEVARRGGKKDEEFVVEADTVTNQFIYLRRFKDELQLARSTFFADYEYKFPDWDFRVQGWEAQASPTKYAGMKNRPWATIGYFVALSVAQNFKSVQFPNVKTIIYDEFIAEEGVQYLPKEPSKLINFLNTVDRSKDKTRMLLLANSVVVANPYFIHYEVDPNNADKDGFIKQAGGYLLWHFPEAKEYVSEVNKTAYGKFILATDPEYAAYAVNNQFSDNHDSMVEGKDYKARYLMTLETRKGIFSIWYNFQRNIYFCQKPRPAGDEDFVTIEPGLMAEGKRLMTFNDKPMQMLRTAYRQDRMRFDGPPSRNAFVEIMKR